MSSSASARHRAEVTKTSALAVIAKTVGSNAGGMGRQAAVIAAASGLVLSSGLAANAADSGIQREAATATALDVQSSVPAVIAAASSVAISFERPAVTTTPAPVVEEPAPVVEVKEAPEAPAPAPAAAPVAQQAAPAAKAAPAPAAASTGLNSTILAAAYAQIGVNQDCTMLVTNSLAAVGIHFHDWPAGYLSLGRTVSAAEAQPGDIVYYANGGAGVAHVAIYAGNGQAVHGGYNGNQTVLFSVNVGSGPVFIRVNG
ncbi:NlpC/P60 family protein [Pseudarthrobacter sp. J75]|uniref:NlpC/P60 family protein n=1 Tax=unclassified Pseudarthrobacter TaxID=2647000 RepID=UPI002E80137A|nr:MULTISPECIES: NlpC/P60 family protein [unclassified Pseudarthrobacter]MEE2523207.1 NlpC/P60 family protein [Pseudarthrobacter sp. J47]MEE2527462.1 NlpC/P60 family protein [Pseudarthrobacter sp. J75]MEE2569841.1 NlpC/P60 family protein [Pseudarthrobacter sp. J64]